jgi:DNA-binding NtrC family response regulator
VPHDQEEAWELLAGGPLDAPAAADALPAEAVRGAESSAASTTPAMPLLGRLGGLSLDEYLRRVESECIASALIVSGGNKSRAARLLGIKRSTLGDRILRRKRD